MLFGFKRIYLEMTEYLQIIMAFWFPVADATARDGFLDTLLILLLSIYSHANTPGGSCSQ